MLNTCLRELAYLCALHELEIEPVHLSTESNRLSDLLSRAHLCPENIDLFLQESEFLCQEILVTQDLFEFVASW